MEGNVLKMQKTERMKDEERQMGPRERERKKGRDAESSLEKKQERERAAVPAERDCCCRCVSSFGPPPVS